MEEATGGSVATSVQDDTLRIDAGKVGYLIDLVGELSLVVAEVVHQPQSPGFDPDEFEKSAYRLQAMLRDLQNSVLGLRLVAVGEPLRADSRERPAPNFTKDSRTNKESFEQGHALRAALSLPGPKAGVSRARLMNQTTRKPVRVLIVDDSALVRKILASGMSKDPDIQVIGQAANPYQARDIMVEQQPDVITLDVEMPRMDGITFLKRFMPIMPIPTVIISSLTQEGKRITLDALAAGAVDVIPKPVTGLVDGLPPLTEDINRRARPPRSPTSPATPTARR